jgi:nitroimidazol reductase NimA-like FMN-containing flavoprotein (pyridoxamine 5'-phosphate oxidase superfamily)
MRRKDKEIKSRKEMEAVIKSVNVCRVGFVDGEKPYVLPLNFGYSKSIFYIHSAGEGKKLDLIAANNNVFVEIDTNGDIVRSSDPCGYGFRYKSLLAPGKAYIINDTKNKIKALGIIMKHITGMTISKFSESKVAAIKIIMIKTGKMTGKKSGYN